jgi:hypothetical protein
VIHRPSHIEGTKRAIAAFVAVMLLSLAWDLFVLSPTSAMAADVSSYVTGITTEAEVYESYSTVECTITYSTGSGIRLSSGDTISASWSPTTGTTYASGFTTTFDVTLSDSNASIGTASVTETGLTITFNENVESVQNLSGSVTFSLKVTNTGTGNGTVAISSGGSSTSITVLPSTASTASPVYKTGEWRTDDSNLVDWVFRVNRSYASTFTSDVTITDVIPSGLTYAGITEVNVYTEGDMPIEDGEADDAEGIASLMERLGITASYDSATDTLTITIPQDTANAYYIYFQFTTSVSDSSSLGSSVTNTAIASYGTEASEYTKHGISETLTVPSSGGGSDADGLGTITVLKYVEGTTDPIPGVIFKVYKLDEDGSHVSGWYDSDEDGTDDADYATITTDPTGVASLAALTDGYYELVETSAPAWVVISDRSNEVLVDSGASTTTNVTIENDIVTTNVSIAKVWDDDGDAAGDRPSAEEFASWLTLLADGEAVDGATPTVTDNGDDTFTVTYSDVDAYDSQGNEITYSVVESIPSDYDDYASTSSSIAAGGTLVNSYEPDEDGGSSTDDGGTSDGNDGSSTDGGGTSDAARRPEATVIPTTGDATQPVVGIVLVAIALIALSWHLRRSEQ